MLKLDFLHAKPSTLMGPAAEAGQHAEAPMDVLEESKFPLPHVTNVR